MELKRIVTMANRKVRIQFNAMERSLRATGCDLPIWVIPFDDDRFDLPEGSTWWEIEPLLAWSKQHNMFSMCRKYQCFLIDNYQYVDSDIIFLRNPETVLESMSGFVTSCTHWNNPDHTFNDQTKAYFSACTTIWQSKIFNAGQFACDRQLYTLETLKAACAGEFKSTLIDEINIYKDQVAINLLVHLAGVAINNTTLPPYNMESSWAGDYKEAGFELRYWSEKNRMPYIVHWAGVPIYRDLAINKYFEAFLTADEKKEWERMREERRANSKALTVNRLRLKIHKVRRALKAM